MARCPVGVRIGQRVVELVLGAFLALDLRVGVAAVVAPVDGGVGRRRALAVRRSAAGDRDLASGSSRHLLVGVELLIAAADIVLDAVAREGTWKS